MPEARLQRTRAAYGVTERESRKAIWRRLVSEQILANANRWRAAHDNAAERLERRAFLTDRDPGDETPWGV